jgi:hypothetical protein
VSPLRQAPAGLTTQDTNRRGEYLAEVLRVLYPRPCVAAPVDVITDEPTIVEYLAVPDVRRARLLVPTRPLRVAGLAVRRYAQPASRLARVKRDLASLATATGAAHLRSGNRIRVSGPRAASIDGYLSEALGRELALSVHIGPARANRKPVLQLLSPRGDTVGFAKLGTNPLTKRLVRLETTALTTLQSVGLSMVDTPRVLHAGSWRGNEILVQSALPAWQAAGRGRRVLPERLSAAMRELAWCLGVSTGSLAVSDYWKSLRGKLDLVATRGDEGSALASAAEQLVSRAGHAELTYGAWHGDWAPWNMAATTDTILVWDWERFTPGVPVGFDAVHYALQVRLERGEEAGAAVDAMLGGAADILAPFDVDEPRVTALLYLVDLAARYLGDRQAEAGARLGVLGNWLLPVLIRRVEEL